MIVFCDIDKLSFEKFLVSSGGFLNQSEYILIYTVKIKMFYCWYPTYKYKRHEKKVAQCSNAICFNL